MQRRKFMRGAAVLGGTAVLAPGLLARALAAPAQPGPGPYGPYPADGGGKTVGLPAGFKARVIARAGQPVGPRGYLWHPFPDGGATFVRPGVGWVYVSNSEVPGLPLGGAGAIKFDANGRIVDAYRILNGTTMNCAGGATPWNTWLSCEETATGLVWECDPFRAGQGVARPAMGAFAHEAVAVDPVAKVLYLTEDSPTGRLYRFVPDTYPDLRKGTLSVAKIIDAAGHIQWLDIPDPSGLSKPTSQQRPNSTVFNGGEGIYRDGRWMYMSTKGDESIWAFDLDGQRIFKLYKAREHAQPPPLFGVDNIVVSSAGDVYVAEDGGNLRISIITADTLEVAPVIELFGIDQTASEITGPAFSPDGSRLYFSSQRAGGLGVTYEVKGPWRTARVGYAGATAAALP